MAYRRTLGKSGIEVSAVGMGCMGLTHASGDALPTEDASRVIREAFEMGYTFFDTAECYVGRDAAGVERFNEDAVGAALAPVRDQVVIATKFGVRHNADKTLAMDSRPKTIRASLEGSLRRLRTDHVDLYYQHRIDPNVEPEEVAGVMAELIAEGKIRAWGISEATENYLRRADAVCPVAAVQNRYSMLARWHEPLFPVLEELNVALVAFSPMANGFLTGGYSPATSFEGAQDYRDGMPQYTEEGYERDRGVLDLLAELAAEKGATMAQVSLAWMLCKRPLIVPIPGSRRPERLRENLAAADVVLSPDEVTRIDAALDGMDLAVFGGHAARG
ncbi:aldo/keto reductase [Thermophilibacter sp.]